MRADPACAASTGDDAQHHTSSSAHAAASSSKHTAPDSYARETESNPGAAAQAPGDAEASSAVVEQPPSSHHNPPSSSSSRSAEQPSPSTAAAACASGSSTVSTSNPAEQAGTRAPSSTAKQQQRPRPPQQQGSQPQPQPQQQGTQPQPRLLYSPAPRRAPPRKTLIVSAASRVGPGAVLLLRHLAKSDRVAVSVNAPHAWKALETMALARSQALANLGVDLQFEPLQLLPEGSGAHEAARLHSTRSSSAGGRGVLADFARAYGEDVQGASSSGQQPLPAAATGAQQPHAPEGEGTDGDSAASTSGGLAGAEPGTRPSRFLFVGATSTARGRCITNTLSPRAGESAGRLAWRIHGRLRQHGHTQLCHVSHPRQLGVALAALAMCRRRRDEGGLGTPIVLGPDLWLHDGGEAGSAPAMQLRIYVEKVQPYAVD